MDTLNVEAMMREALVEAEAAGKAGEYPIGAVVVIDGAVISRGRSRQRERRSRLAHAELEALQNGGETLWTRHEATTEVRGLTPAGSDPSSSARNHVRCSSGTSSACWTGSTTR